jgi:hypothetical protein
LLFENKRMNIEFRHKTVSSASGKSQINSNSHFMD